MLSLMFRVRTVACAIVAVLLVACGGGATNPGGGGGTVVQPPPEEVVSLHIDVPGTLMQSYQAYPNASVPITVTASSNKGAVTVSCTVEEKPCSNATLLLLGSHWVVASARSDVTGKLVKDSVMTTILPAKFSGKVVAPMATGEYTPQGAYVIVGDKGAEDSVQVGNDGSFSLNSRYAATQKACFIVRGDPNISWLSGCASNSNFGSLNFIGALKSFTPASSDFAGQKFVTDMVKVTQPAPPPQNSSFLRLYAGPVTTFPVGSWKSYPVCVAFARAQSNDVITSADSISFWAILDIVERKHGKDLVKPCSEDEVKAQGGIIVPLQLGNELDLGDINGGIYGDYTSGTITLNSHQAFSNQFFVQHELGHALFGNGHTCAWDSIMRSSCPRYVPDVISGEDVAYNLLKIRTRELERKYNTRFSFAFSINGARLEQGLSEISIPVIDANGNLVP